MNWTVILSKKTMKKVSKMPVAVKQQLFLLLKEIEVSGPVRGNWPNYIKLDKNRHHCHIKKGKSTYVAVWEVIDKKIQLVEVMYAGTNEKAPY
ncbi:MAG: cytotoxic translational repressor of toxin-antitoxin stability system [Deltaproteobacteria bacterium]|nr:MAG: cytotoxic translational repressor of toxin-antitoxin stability system [Deltaproteobacteria bacterium]